MFGTARSRAVFGATAPFFFLLFLAAAPADSADKAAEPRKPAFDLKPPVKSGKQGLFVDEVISMKDLLARQKRGGKLVIFDARSKHSYDSAHIAGAVLPLRAEFYNEEEKFRKGLIKNLPDREKELVESVKGLDRKTPIVTYCSDDCHAGAVLLLQLKRLGFTDVLALEEGFQTWEKAGHPVEKASA